MSAYVPRPTSNFACSNLTTPSMRSTTFSTAQSRTYCCDRFQYCCSIDRTRAMTSALKSLGVDVAAHRLDHIVGVPAPVDRVVLQRGWLGPTDCLDLDVLPDTDDLAVIQADADRVTKRQRPVLFSKSLKWGSHCWNLLTGGRSRRHRLSLSLVARPLRVLCGNPRGRSKATCDKSHHTDHRRCHLQFAENHRLEHSFDQGLNRRRDHPGRQTIRRGPGPHPPLRVPASLPAPRLARDRRSDRARWCQTGPDEPLTQPFATPGTPALDRADRAADPPRRLLAGLSFQVAEHDRHAVAFGQPVDLLMKRRSHSEPISSSMRLSRCR